MKFYVHLMAILAICHMTLAARFNVTCYYDTSSINRGGSANFTTNDLEVSLQYCTHIVYGYVGIKPQSFQITTLDARQQQLFSQVESLKRKYRNVKFLLSLGGDKDLSEPNKYIKLLEADADKQNKFVHSAVKFMQKYHFDGFDLAYQFPRNKPHEHHTKFSSAIKTTKKILKKLNSKVDTSTNRHKQLFSNLVYQLKTELKHKKLLLSLTVLPNVNTTLYFDIPAIIQHLDFVNVAAFDFSTPERNPKAADFFAPLYAPPRRPPQSNVEYQVKQWLSQHSPSNKLNVGIATYGRSWKVNKELKSSEMPIESSLKGPYPGGIQTHTPGLLSWPEICSTIKKMQVHHSKTFGDYAYQPGGVKGAEGMLLTYENPESAADKANFIKTQSLGGVALFDLTLDDFRGECQTGTFPILKSIKFKIE